VIRNESGTTNGVFGARVSLLKAVSRGAWLAVRKPHSSETEKRLKKLKKKNKKKQKKKNLKEEKKITCSYWITNHPTRAT
jgi:hypothetical protein